MDIEKILERGAVLRELERVYDNLQLRYSEIVSRPFMEPARRARLLSATKRQMSEVLSIGERYGFTAAQVQRDLFETKINLVDNQISNLKAYADERSETLRPD